MIMFLSIIFFSLVAYYFIVLVALITQGGDAFTKKDFKATLVPFFLGRVWNSAIESYRKLK